MFSPIRGRWRRYRGTGCTRSEVWRYAFRPPRRQSLTRSSRRSNRPDPVGGTWPVRCSRRSPSCGSAFLRLLPVSSSRTERYRCARGQRSRRGKIFHRELMQIPATGGTGGRGRQARLALQPPVPAGCLRNRSYFTAVECEPDHTSLRPTIGSLPFAVGAGRKAIQWRTP